MKALKYFSTLLPFLNLLPFLRLLPFLTLLPFFSQTLSGTVYMEAPRDFSPKVEVVGVFIENGDEILLLHTQNGKRHAGTWAIPGGKLEKGETAVQAAARETLEETGFAINPESLEKVQTVYIKVTEKDHFIYHMVKTTYKGSPESVKISWREHKGFTWIKPADALNMNLMPDEDPCIRIAYNLF